MAKTATPLMLTPRDAARFQRKVVRRGPDECWSYTGAHFDLGGGYPAFWLAGVQQNVGAHRVACTLAHGPSSLMALHSCDNPKCVNPAHLRWGTNADNQQDRSARGRAPIGEGHARSVVTTQQVTAMRARWKDGESLASLGREYGTSETNVGYIVKRQTWRHVA